MYYTLFDGFLEHLNPECISPIFNLDLVDGQLLHEPHLLIRSDTRDISPQLNHNVVQISDTSGGGFSLPIGLTNLKFHTFIWGMFATPYTASSAAVFIFGSLFANMLLGQVSSVPTFCNSYRFWYWSSISKCFRWTGVTHWILCSNCSFAFCQSASNQLVATCQAVSGASEFSFILW